MTNTMTNTAANTVTGRATMRRPRRRRALAVVALGAVVSALSACTAGAPAPANPLVGRLTTRTVDVSVDGSATYAVDDAPATASGGPAGFAIAYNSSSLVVGVDGTLGYGPSGASITLHLTATPLGISGSATVSDATAAVSSTVTGPVTDFRADSAGNVAGSITEGPTTVAFSTTSVALPPGTDADLEALIADEGDFCRDVQQRLAGLDPSEIPLSAIADVRQPSRADFAGSKATLTPLTVQTWTDTFDTTDAAGAHVVISQHISCKTRAADHIATTGATTGSTDLACSAINQRSIDLALERMTPAQRAAVTVPTLGADIVRTTGAEWTTPLAPDAELDAGGLHAHALLTRWNDPAFSIFPDTIRGVHYCTTWSPAYAYTYLLSTI